MLSSSNHFLDRLTQISLYGSLTWIISDALWDFPFHCSDRFRSLICMLGFHGHALALCLESGILGVLSVCYWDFLHLLRDIPNNYRVFLLVFTVVL